MLLTRVEEMVPQAITTQKRLLQDHGKKTAATVTVEQLIGGLAGAPVIKSFIPGTPHYVDPEESLHIGGVGIFDICRQHTFEWLVWTLYTGSPPTEVQEEWVRERLEAARRRLLKGDGDAYQRVATYLFGVGSAMDPMKAIEGAVSLLAHESRMARKVARGAVHEVTWQDRLQDQLDVLGYLSVIAPLAYRAVYGGHQAAPTFNEGQRFAEAFVDSLIIDGDRVLQARVIDQLLATMCYHGPGNVSTFDAIVANSGGANVHEVFGAMVNALRGYNHGGAAEQGVRVLFELRDNPDLGLHAAAEALAAHAEERLDAGLAIWCVGHRVIRGKKGDKRSHATLATLDEISPDNPFVALARRWYQAGKDAVTRRKTIGFPDVNVDGYTGLLAHVAGIIDEPRKAAYAGAIFATSRASGAFAETFWQAVGPLRLIRPSAHSEESIRLLPAAA